MRWLKTFRILRRNPKAEAQTRSAPVEAQALRRISVQPSLNHRLDLTLRDGPGFGE